VKSRSGSLLKAVIDAKEFTTGDMARELASTPSEVDAYLGGTEVMTLPRQLCLAKFVIEKSPRFARAAHTLQAQVAAALAFQDHSTKVHNEPPTTWQTGPKRKLT
jgi:hypothetical protein